MGLSVIIGFSELQVLATHLAGGAQREGKNVGLDKTENWVGGLLRKSQYNFYVSGFIFSQRESARAPRSLASLLAQLFNDKL